MKSPLLIELPEALLFEAGKEHDYAMSDYAVMGDSRACADAAGAEGEDAGRPSQSEPEGVHRAARGAREGRALTAARLARRCAGAIIHELPDGPEKGVEKDGGLAPGDASLEAISPMLLYIIEEARLLDHYLMMREDDEQQQQ